jgi:uncharacterized protein YhhL (DUF1145 family)
MNSTLLMLVKGGAVIFYAVALASPVVPALAPYATTLFIIAGVLVLAHLGEYIMVRKRLNALPASENNHFIGVLLFGFIYWLPLLKAGDK